MNSGTVARYTNGQLIEGRPRCNNTFPGYANGGCYYFTAASNGTYIFDEQTGSFVEINNVNRPRFTHDLNINMYGGTINGSLYGGSNYNGTVYADIDINFVLKNNNVKRIHLGPIIRYNKLISFIKEISKNKCIKLNIDD